MGIWGNMADRMTGALCKNLVGNLMNKLPLKNVPTAPPVPLLPGLIGGASKKAKTTSKPLRLPFPV